MTSTYPKTIHPKAFHVPTSPSDSPKSPSAPAAKMYGPVSPSYEPTSPSDSPTNYYYHSASAKTSRKRLRWEQSPTEECEAAMEQINKSNIPIAKRYRAMHLVAMVLAHVARGSQNTPNGMHSIGLMRGVMENV